MSDSIFITRDQVAKELGYGDPLEFSRQRHRLETEHGFPPPVPLMRQARYWRRDEVTRWRDNLSGYQTDDQAPEAMASTSAEASARRAALMKRAQSA